jgi:hypothetical protein
MKAGLQLARDFALDLDVVTEATAIVATRGAGKSSTSAVMIEEGIAAGVQVVVLDRTGVYWGLRSSKSGTGPGLGIYVLGGPHGDVPLEPHAGVLIANLVVDSGHSFVLDLSDFSKTAAVKFSADFLERLYDRKARARTTLMLVIDEAHFYAPQSPRGGFKGDGARLMGAMEDVVGQGRSRGLGVVLTTQRTQALNKAVLDLLETLLVMRMLSPRAREAVRDWIKEKHEDDELGVIASLESLPTGTAWVWSPLRGILQKIAVRRIKTFDSYATPKPGETRLEPTKRKELDLAALGKQMEQTVERTKQNDPAELKKRIRELERRATIAPAVIERPGEQQTVEVEKIVEVEVAPFTSAALAPMWALIDTSRAALDEAAGKLLDLEKTIDALPVAGTVSSAERAPVAKTVAPPPRRETAVAHSAGRPARDTPARSADDDDVKLGKGERKVLEVLAEYPEGRTQNELAFLAGYSAKASTVGVILANLRRAGLVEPGQPIRSTMEGLEAAGGARERPTGQALLNEWLGHPRMGEGERRVLLTLIEAAPHALSHEDLAERTGYSPSASTLGVILSKLRKLGLVEKGARRVAPEFQEAIAA